MWIHECDLWPNFTWNAEVLLSKLAQIRYQQGRLLGQMESLGFELKREASLGTLTNDIVKTSAIEDNKLNPQEVRSSIARRLGINLAGLIPVSRHVDGIVEILLDATQKFDTPLTKERLFSWHSGLFPSGHSGLYRITVGKWRTPHMGPMQVVSGRVGQPKVHYQTPDATRLNTEMQLFLKWFNKNQNLDPIIKAGIAHLWFVTLHPFEDGNGQIARAIGDMILARADGTSSRFYSLSSQIEAERKDYYKRLEKQQRSSTEITAWLIWFLDCLGRSIFNAHESLHNVLFKARLWSQVNQKTINERQRLVIKLMLEDHFKGYMNTSKYAKLAKCSNDTALRDIQVLKNKGIFIQNPGGGRSVSYKLPNPID